MSVSYGWPNVPRARYINTVIIEVVFVLFDPEIQSLSKYHVVQSHSGSQAFAAKMLFFLCKLSCQQHFTIMCDKMVIGMLTIV